MTAPGVALLASVGRSGVGVDAVTSDASSDLLAPPFPTAAPTRGPSPRRASALVSTSTS